MSHASDYISAILKRKNAVIKQEGNPTVIEVGKVDGILRTITQYAVFEDGRVSVAMKDLDNENAKPEVFAQYRAENSKIGEDGSIQVLKKGW